MDAATWDARYRESELVWSAGPNQFVADRVARLTGRPGTAVDLAAGEGRNALWLAREGWVVTAVDFSREGLAKGQRLAAADPPPMPVTWEVGDALTWQAPEPVDLVVVAYLQLPPAERSAAMRNAWSMVAPGGLLLVVAHDSINPTLGSGGPQDPEVLYTAGDVLADLESALTRGVDRILEAGVVARDVSAPAAHPDHDSADTAYDALVALRRG